MTLVTKDTFDPKNKIALHNLWVDEVLFDFIEKEVAPATGLNTPKFWQDFSDLMGQLAPKNKQLLEKRDQLQSAIDDWHRAHPGALDRTHPDAANSFEAYKNFLTDIGYLSAYPEKVKISTKKVDDELSKLAGPQLVVPILNARYALNAANARWGSLYDALYGSDVIPETEGCGRMGTGAGGYNPNRGALVIEYCRHVLDHACPLTKGSHVDSVNYAIKKGALKITLKDGSTTSLKNNAQFVGYQGSELNPTGILLVNNGLHLDVRFDQSSVIGAADPAGVCDLVIESALSTILDLEDSIAAVDASDKVAAYRNWLGILQGTLTEEVSKGGKTFTRALNLDRIYVDPTGEKEIKLHGRALLFIRNVGHLMTTPAIHWRDEKGAVHEAPEGIMDAVITSLIGLVDLKRAKSNVYVNSRKGSIYIVKPKMHGPEEVAFSDELFSQVETMLGIEKNTIKLGIMDEERRTSVNLRACIAAAASRVAFINTGFLDRTGDEIHTDMHAGPMLRKAEMRQSTWLKAYELNNVRVGLGTGMRGKAQIGKGMWAMPDLMAAMMAQKIVHPQSGANTAWVPSPTSATLHALHYHQVDVPHIQMEMEIDYNSRPVFKEYNKFLNLLLTLPIAANPTWSAEEIQAELDNNAQGILGYVVRWIEMGVGCSKVPDIHNVGLMEDRATLRISSQHIANWLLHGVVSRAQVEETLLRMAKIVDAQNAKEVGYVPMSVDPKKSMAFQAASDLIFKGLTQPNGYTEPLLHAWRLKVKCRIPSDCGASDF